MADADGRNSVPPLPPLPPIEENESQQPAQHFPHVCITFVPGVCEFESTTTGANNTPLHNIIASITSNPGGGGGSLSSVTNNMTSPAVVATTAPTANNAASLMSPTTPDFSRALSDTNAYLSGDDKDAWYDEGDKIMSNMVDQQTFF